MWKEVALRISYCVVLVVDSGIGFFCSVVRHQTAGLREWLRLQIFILEEEQRWEAPVIAFAVPHQVRGGRVQLQQGGGSSFAHPTVLVTARHVGDHSPTPIL